MKKVLEYCQSVGVLHGVSIVETASRSSRATRAPRRYDDDIITETTGTRQEQTSESYKVDIYYPVLDAFISELKRRFSEKNKVIMKSLQACCQINFFS